jgi:hypothetical protein
VLIPLVPRIVSGVCRHSARSSLLHPPARTRRAFNMRMQHVLAMIAKRFCSTPNVRLMRRVCTPFDCSVSHATSTHACICAACALLLIAASHMQRPHTHAYAPLCSQTVNNAHGGFQITLLAVKSTHRTRLGTTRPPLSGCFWSVSSLLSSLEYSWVRPCRHPPVSHCARQPLCSQRTFSSESSL